MTRTHDPVEVTFVDVDDDNEVTAIVHYFRDGLDGQVPLDRTGTVVVF